VVGSEELFNDRHEKKLRAQATPLPVWDGPEYQRVTPGRYSATAVRVQGPEWVRRFKRWSLMVEFELLSESETVRICAFFNMGNDPECPKAGRQTRFYRAWTIANGEPPRKGQKMDPKTFLDGQIYEIEVTDCGEDPDAPERLESEVYSKVARIITAYFPS
jgi:hypothetical protein